MKKIYTCFNCGFPFAVDESEVPDYCPSCSAPKEQYLEEPWAGSIEMRRIHVDPPAPDESRDPYDISYHVAKPFIKEAGNGKVRRFVLSYDEPETLRTFYREVCGWDIVDTDHSDPKNPLMYCATGPGTDKWEPSIPSFEYGFIKAKNEKEPDASFVVQVKNLEDTLEKTVKYGGKVLRGRYTLEEQEYALIEDSEGNAFYLWEIAGIEKPSVNPGRPPKKFTRKSLHGRTRIYLYTYKELRRFQTFCINVFGWDMIEMPEAVSAIKPGDEHPALIIGTGPCQADYEGSVPGHMNLMVFWTPGELAEPGPYMEISMDRPLKDTLADIEKYGGRVITDKAESFLARVPVDEDSWEPTCVVKDPAGNYLYLWKCPSSRTWEEPETGYDKE